MRVLRRAPVQYKKTGREWGRVRARKSSAREMKHEDEH